MSASQTISAVIPTEKLGPPGIRGQLHILAVLQDERRIDQERLEDTSEREFKIRARLSKSPLGVEGILENFTEKDGGSYLLMSDKTAVTKIDSPEGQFIVHKTRRMNSHSSSSPACLRVPMARGRNFRTESDRFLITCPTLRILLSSSRRSG
jgi:hypothetical protein